jgi:putative transposase
MPTPKSPKIVLNELLTSLLTQIKRSRTSSIRSVERCSMILLMSQGVGNKPAAKQLGFSIDQCKRWRLRWLSYAPTFKHIEETTTAAKLSSKMLACIETCLSDLPRPGTPCTFTSEQYCRIIALSLELPEQSGRPISEWTPREIADEAIKRGIVERISISQVRSFLKRERS